MPSLLIADDHPLFRAALRQAARDALGEVELFEAGTLDAVLALLDAQSQVDLVLLDLHLPDGDGFTLIEEIHQAHQGLPIVVLSSTELSTEQLSFVEAALAKSRTEPQAFLNVLARLLPTKGDDHA